MINRLLLPKPLIKVVKLKLFVKLLQIIYILVDFNTKVAKIVSKVNTTSIKVKALKKGTTTLKIRVNGVKVLRLKVKVK